MCVICISFRWAIDVNVLGWVVLSVDLRDAVGDRLYLSKSFTRDGVSTFVANTILPLTIPTDPLRRQPSYFTQVRHPLLSSSPSLINLPLNREHSEALSARQAIAQSRKSRGFLSTIFRRSGPAFRPTYNHKSDGSACRVYGTLEVKKVTGERFLYLIFGGFFS